MYFSLKIVKLMQFHILMQIAQLHNFPYRVIALCLCYISICSCISQIWKFVYISYKSNIIFIWRPPLIPLIFIIHQSHQIVVLIVKTIVKAFVFLE